jgi:hypothetical protein
MKEIIIFPLDAKLKNLFVIAVEKVFGGIFFFFLNFQFYEELVIRRVRSRVRSKRSR